MSLKLVTRDSPRERQPYESPVDADAALLDENGNTAFPVAGLVAALGGVTPVSQAIVPTAAGDGTGVIADGGLITVCTVTSANAAHIVTLPTPTPGMIVVLLGNATGYELRSSAPATVGIGGDTPGADHESAIPASSIAVAICLSATMWLGLTITGETLAAIETAA